MKVGISKFLSAVTVLGVLGLPVRAAQSAGAKFITFDAPGAGQASGQGTGCFAYTGCSVIINNSGAITGYYLDANNVFHGFVRSRKGKFTSFEAPGADTTPGDFNGTEPNAINDAGAIAGVYYDINNVAHGFLPAQQMVRSFKGGWPPSIHPAAPQPFPLP